MEHISQFIARSVKSGAIRLNAVNVMVTACPFCLVNIENAIKVAGFEGKMEAVDLSELIVQYMQSKPVDGPVAEPQSRKVM